MYTKNVFWTKDGDSTLIVLRSLQYFRLCVYIHNNDLQIQLLNSTMINPLTCILFHFSLIRKPENQSVRTRKRILKEFSNYCFQFKLPIWQGFMFSLQDNACNFLAIFVTILFAQNWYIEGVSSSEKKGIYCFRYRHSRWV